MSLGVSRHVHASGLGAAAVLATLLSVLTAAPVAAANNVVIAAFMDDCQFHGTNAGANKTVKIEWRDSDGNLKTKHSVTSNASGQFLTKCEPGEIIEAGDVLKTTIGTSIRSFTVPKLTANASRVSNFVTGRVSPAPDTLIVDAYTYDGGFSPGGTTLHEATPVPSGEDYTVTSYDVPADLKGFDEVYTYWIDARGDTFARFIRVEGILVWERQQFFLLVGNALEPVDTKLYDDSATLLDEVTGRLNRDGRFLGDFLDVDGDPLRIRPGYQVQGGFAIDATFDVPAITATASKSADKVTVSCGGSSSPFGIGTGVEVDIHTRDFTREQVRDGFTNGSNVFVANFAVSPAYNVASGDKVDVFCKDQDTGDIVARTFTVS